MSIPIVGHVVVLGYLASMVFSGVETAAVAGSLSALGAAMFSIVRRRMAKLREQRSAIEESLAELTEIDRQCDEALIRQRR